MPLTEQQFAEILALRYEPRGLEFKGAHRRSDRLFFARVVRACLGMANLRDGGRVIIGVDEQGGVLDPVGLSDADLATWRYDDIAAGLATYADPMISFDVHVHEYQGRRFVELEVHEFEELPILCKTMYQERQERPPRQEVILREGACYVRRRGKPETSEIPTQSEMRELLDLAIEKGVRRFIARARAVGLALGGGDLPRDEERFAEQLRELEPNE